MKKMYLRTDEYKLADRERIVKLKGLQKRANKPAETITESKLEPTLCNLQSAETEHMSVLTLCHHSQIIIFHQLSCLYISLKIAPPFRNLENAVAPSICK